MNLEGKTIALLSPDDFEDVESTEPLKAVREAGVLVYITPDGDK